MIFLFFMTDPHICFDTRLGIDIISVTSHWLVVLGMTWEGV